MSSEKSAIREQERKKCMKEINELRMENEALKKVQLEDMKQISELKEKLSRSENDCAKYRDWTERLLDYMDMPADKLEEIKQREAVSKDLRELLSGMLDITKSGVFRF